eukprot:8073659-Pyramimonas_sp.AAC.1
MFPSKSVSKGFGPRGVLTPSISLRPPHFEGHRRRLRFPAFEPAHPGCPRSCPSWTAGIGSDGSPRSACEPKGEFDAWIARVPYFYPKGSPGAHPEIGCARFGLSMPSSGPTSARTFS